MEREDDVQLIYNILSGDEDAFSVLVQKYQKSVHALVWRKIGDFHHAEEITQDTFLQAYKKLPTLKEPHQFAGWLYVIANRFCIDWLRKKKLAVQSIEDTPMAEIEKSSYTHHLSQQQQIETSERRREIVKNLLARLPESERTVVTLYYLGEMKVKEISKFLGVSVSTINTRLHRARKRLQEEEFLVQEVLGGVQISEHLIHNIMRQVSDIKLTPSPTTKPLLPWLAFGTTVILIALMLGASNQYLLHFQQPYSFDAQSEHTIEIIDAPIVLDIDSKPDIRNQTGRDTPSGHTGNAGSRTSETLLTSTVGENSGMHKRNIELCTQNLIAIGTAIQTYQKEYEDFPEWLSDLHPKYLADAHVFICPADDKNGTAGFNPDIDLVAIGKAIQSDQFDTDPRTPMSYGYQLAPEYRQKKIEQRLVFGDVIPLVRCWHHVNEDFEVLNLSFSSQIYKSSIIWEHTPEDMYGSREAALTAIEEILARPPDDKRCPDYKRFFDLYPQLVRLYTLLGNEQSAAALIERLKSGMIQDLQGYQTLFDLLKTVERYEDLLVFFQEAEQQYPDEKFIFYKLADIHRKLGNTELAEAYERKFDSISHH